MAAFKIEINCFDGIGGADKWQDITDYVSINWSSGEIGGERGCLNIIGGNVSLSIIDNNTDLSTRHWIETLAGSDSIPALLITRSSDSTVIFYGRMEPDLYTYENNVMTGFTACSILDWAKKLDVYNAIKDEYTSGQYSGDAATILTKVIRYLGCEENVEIPDVVIKDFNTLDVTRGDPNNLEECAGWNIMNRYWESLLSTRNVETSSEILPAPQGVTSDILGFVIKFGHLFRIRKTNEITTLEEVLDISGEPYTTTAHRLFRFDCESGEKGMAVIECEARSTYFKMPTPNTALGYTGQGLGISAATLAIILQLIPGTQPVGWTIAAVAAGVAGGAAQIINSTLYKSTSNGDRLYGVTGWRVLSIGDGEDYHTSGGGGGVGYIIDRPMDFATYTRDGESKAGYALQELTFTMGDSICVSQDNINGDCKGLIWTVQRNDNTAKMNIYNYYWDTTANPERWHSSVIKVTEPNWPWEEASIPYQDYGSPAGGCASAYGCLAFGTTSGVVMFGLEDYLLDRVRKIPHLVKLNTSPSNYMAMLPTINSDGHTYLNIIPGNACGWYIKQKVQDNIGQIVFPDATKESFHYELGPSFDGEIIFANPYLMDASSWISYTTVVFQKAKADGSQGLYSGIIKTKFTGDEGIYIVDKFATIDMPPLPNTGAWSPTMVYYDNAQEMYRFVGVSSNTDDNYNIFDIVETSLYAKARIHQDFKLNKMSCGDLIEQAAKSFWLYVKLNDPSPITSNNDVRIVSRHYYNPSIIGEVGKDNVVKSPRIDGIEYYDGAVTSAGGYRYGVGNYEYQGANGVGKSTFNADGTFMTSFWGQIICNSVIDLYPFNSAKYPCGRRRFVPDVIDYEQTPSNIKPSFADIHGIVAVSVLDGIVSHGVIESTGLNRGSLTYPSRIIETSITGEGDETVVDGVTWESDAPEMDAVLASSTPYPTFVEAVGSDNPPVEGIVEVTGSYEVVFVVLEYVVCNSSDPITITLQEEPEIGRELHITNKNSGLVTVEGYDDELIDGSATRVLNQWESIHLKYVSDNLWIVL